MTATQFARALRRYCRDMDASVIAYGRTKHFEGLMTGDPDGPHARWLAADVVYDDPPAITEREVRAGLLELYLEHKPYYDVVRARAEGG